MAPFPSLRRRFLCDRYQQLAAGCVVVAALVAALETWVPNAARITVEETELTSDYLIDFVPRRLHWDVPFIAGWAGWLFDYRVLIVGFALLGFTLLVVSERSSRRIRSLQSKVDASLKGGPDRDEESPEKGDEYRPRLRAELRRREEILEPIIGALFLTTVVWLVAVGVAGKLDPGWSRPFLAAPFLVAQNLQHFGAPLFESTVRSTWHLAQGVAWGCIAGVLLGFLLSHARWLQRWTAWHLTVVSALPPFIMIEVFKQIARLPGFPAFWVHNETAFKSAIAMASWAVTWPVLAATALALSKIDPEYRFSTRLLGARSTFERLRHIDLPVILPAALSNLRVGIVIGLIVLLYGEAQGGPSNLPTLGFYFSAFTADFKLQCLMALLVFTSLLVVVFELFTRFAELRLVASDAKLRKPRQEVGELRQSVAEEGRNCLERFEQQRREKWPQPPWSSPAGQPVIHIRDVRKLYGDILAFEVRGEKFIERGEFVSIIGRSGAGKSTLLKLLLGFEEPEPGGKTVLLVDDLDMAHAASDAAARLGTLVAYISQRPLLLPHRTVEQNVLFGIKQQWRHLDSATDGSASAFLRAFLCWLCGTDDPRTWEWRRGEYVRDTPLGLLIRFLALESKMTSYPGELSGGEAQRVHLLRWLVLGRSLLIMDEAFSALDQPLKAMVRDAIHRHAKALGITVINVSHDRSDVLQVSDRILFIDEHTIRDDGPPRKLYYAPLTRDLAVFLGHTNLFDVRAPQTDSHRVLLLGDAYRKTAFDPPQELALEEGLERPARKERSLASGPEDWPLAEGGSKELMFISRSDVNITELLAREPRGEEDFVFRIDGMRFTGTHYEVRLSRTVGDGVLRMDTVIQDDDLQVLLEQIGADGVPEDRSGALHARVAIRRGLVISKGGAGA